MRIGEATNEAELVAAVEAARERRLNLRRGYETFWWNNIALVSGDHYARWNPTLSQYEDHDPNFVNTDGKKPRMVVNHALTVGRTELSKLTKSRPIMDIIANSDEQADIAATKVGRAALDFAEWKFRLQKHRKTALWWMIQTGLSAIYVGYDHLDDKAGFFEYTIDPETGDAVFDPARVRELQGMVDRGEIDDVKVERFPLGELEYKVFSPFQLLPDETALEFESIKDLITTEVHDIDVVKGLYGKSARDLNPDSNLTLGTMESRMMTRANVPGGVGSLRGATVDSGIQVNTYWLLPNTFRGNKFLKDGICLRWASGRKVLELERVFPYQDGRMPFVFFEHIPSSASIWPDCVMTHIRGPNLEIDKTVSQLIENKDYMANPMWRIATQHKIQGKIKNVAGGIVRYRHVPNIPPPEPVQGLQMPAQVESLLVGLREQILDISGQSEVARGRVPSGVRSGVAVAYLQEEDDTKLAPTVDNMEEAIAMMGSLTLERFAQYYYLERILRFYRRDGVFDVRRFKGADLKNNTDVVCQSGSAMPKSKAARQQFTLELASLGIEKDPRKLKDMLELGEGEPDDVDKAVAQANRENNMMLHGVWKAQTSRDAQDPNADGEFEKMVAAVPVKAWHNHDVHIARHTSVMMDEEFDDLAITRPEIVRLFDEHLNMHYQQKQAQQQQMMDQLMAAKGAPDGPPTPAGGDPTAPGGGNGSSFISQADVPDVIGRGVVQTRARQVRPQG